MHIVVCMKQVPDSAQIRVHPVTNTIMRQGVPTIINPYDLFALEEALHPGEAQHLDVMTTSPTLLPRQPDAGRASTFCTFYL